MLRVSPPPLLLDADMVLTCMFCHYQVVLTIVMFFICRNRRNSTPRNNAADEGSFNVGAVYDPAIYNLPSCCEKTRRLSRPSHLPPPAAQGLSLPQQGHTCLRNNLKGPSRCSHSTAAVAVIRNRRTMWMFNCTLAMSMLMSVRRWWQQEYLHSRQIRSIIES